MRLSWLVALLVGFSAPTSATASCDDAASAATTRSAVEAVCPCGTIPDAPTYRSCARSVVAARLAAGTLSSACGRQVLRCVRRSTCGRAGRVTCCRSGASGSTRCRVTDAARCTASNGCVGSAATCCDACGTSGCNATTTTTLGPRNCGNYVIDAGEMCDGEPFCESCFVPTPVCCQFGGPPETCSYDLDYPFICDPGFAGQIAVYGVHATGTGTCAVGAGSDGPCGAPTSFMPTSICCERPGACTTVVVSDTAELALRVLSNDCLLVQGGQPVPVSVVGTCAAPDGPCVRTH